MIPWPLLWKLLTGLDLLTAPRLLRSLVTATRVSRYVSGGELKNCPLAAGELADGVGRARGLKAAALACRHALRFLAAFVDGNWLRVLLHAFHQVKVVPGLSCLARYVCGVGGCATPGKACTIKPDAGGSRAPKGL